MKITAVSCMLLSAPYATPEDAERVIHLQTGYRSAAFIKVETDEGLTGLGETYAGVYAPEAVAALVSQFEADLLDRDPMDILAIWNRLRLASYYWGRMGISQSVLGGIEMALWDLNGKAFGVPVYELMGGKVHESLPVYASGGNNKPADELKAEMRGYVREGYKAVKIRINHLPDIAAIENKVATCRAALDTGIGLAVDAVQGVAEHPWPVETAVEVAQAIEPYDILWIEEPAEVTDYQGFAEIRGLINIPVAGGETVTSLPEAKSYLDSNSLDLFQPDASLIGGLHIFRQVAKLCARKHMPVAVHAWCGGIGIMGNFHAAFATENCAWLELSNVPNPLREEVMVEPLRFEDGKLKAPTAPGLGVHLPDNLVQQYPYRPGSFYRVLGQ